MREPDRFFSGKIGDHRCFDMLNALAIAKEFHVRTGLPARWCRSLRAAVDGVSFARRRLSARTKSGEAATHTIAVLRPMRYGPQPMQRMDCLLGVTGTPLSGLVHDL